MILDHLILQESRLSGEALHAPVLAVALVGRILGDPLSLLAGAVLVFAVWRARLPGRPWSALQHGHELRGFLVFVCAITAWRAGTYEYNYFLDQAHYLDRALLFAMLPLVYWRPVFILPFVFLVAALNWQFSFPLGSHSWAQEYMPIRILTLSFAAFAVGGFHGRFRVGEYVFLLCCLVASHYWIPGLGKLELLWPQLEQLGNLVAATYANGWLGFLAPHEASALALAVTEVNAFLVWAALAFQVSALFLFWRQRLLLAFFGLASAFHLAVFSLSGILFWQWMLIDIALIALLAGLWRGQTMPFCGFRYLVLGAVLVGGSAVWFKPVKLAWYDVPVSYTYRFEAIGESGRRYSLPPRFFAPFDYQTTLGNFGYLVDRPHLGIVWGASGDAKLARALAAATSVEEVFALERAFGRNRYDARRAERFDRFVKRFVSTLNRRGSEASVFGLLNPPPQLWTFGKQDAFDGGEAIASVEVYQVTSLLSHSGYSEIEKSLVRRIAVPVAPAPAGGVGT